MNDIINGKNLIDKDDNYIAVIMIVVEFLPFVSGVHARDIAFADGVRPPLFIFGKKKPLGTVQTVSFILMVLYFYSIRPYFLKTRKRTSSIVSLNPSNRLWSFSKRLACLTKSFSSSEYKNSQYALCAQ